jgi:glucan phosphoethanolaminetransferase (alkaline phosphatase superfamily)
MKSKTKKNLLVILSVIVAIVVLIAFIEPVQKVLPAGVVNFASSFYTYFLAALIFLLAALLWPISWIVGLSLILIGAVIVFSSLPKRRED